MRPYVIAANWKMNKDIDSGINLVQDVRKLIEEKDPPSNVKTILCPPFILLEKTQKILAGSSIALGAQNMHFENDGAYTGEISGTMLKSVGCKHVILGHSERRTYFDETDAIINKKVHKALEVGLDPIVCVGETLDQREAGVTTVVVEAQVRSVLADVTEDNLNRIIMAYEPVWAIGTGRNAAPGQAQEVHAFIRNLIEKMYSAAAAKNFIIQYGGSMKTENAGEILAQPDVDGGLIGGASLAARQFAGIIEAAVMLCDIALIDSHSSL